MIASPFPFFIHSTFLVGGKMGSLLCALLLRLLSSAPKKVLLISPCRQVTKAFDPYAFILVMAFVATVVTKLFCILEKFVVKLLLFLFLAQACTLLS